MTGERTTFPVCDVPGAVFPRCLTSRQKGIALVMVLWGGMLLSVMAASFAFSMRVETTIAGNYVQRAQAQALAEAGVRRGILALFEPDAVLRWRPDGSVHELPYGPGKLRIAVSSENGKIDLNAAPVGLIYGLFDSLAESNPELSTEDARHLANAVLDWRESDSRARLRGMAGEVYRTASLGGGRNGAFLSAGELSQLPGMKPEILAALAKSVTVFSQTPKVDPASASRQVLIAIPGLDGSIVDQFLAAREAFYNSGAQDQEQGLSLALALLAPGARYLSRTASSVFTVDAEGMVPGGASVRRKAVVSITGNRTRPYAILAWADPLSTAQTDEGECCRPTKSVTR